MHGFSKSHSMPHREVRPGRAPLVYIVVLNYMGAKLTVDCVSSVLRIAYPNFRVVVVDNASPDDSVAILREAYTDPRVEILVNGSNEGYAGGNNRGIERALSGGAKYILVLNNDTIADPSCLISLLEVMESDPRLGIAGCPILDLLASRDSPVTFFGNRISLFTGSVTPMTGGADWTDPHEVDAVCGAAIFLRKEMIERVGMFDSKFFLTWEETDLCYRARRAGYKVCAVPGPGITHLRSQTLSGVRPLGLFCDTRNRAWFVRRHGRLKHRVVYNLFHFGYFYPRIILGRLLRREFELVSPILRGIWQGHWHDPGPLRVQ